MMRPRNIESLDFVKEKTGVLFSYIVGRLKRKHKLSVCICVVLRA